MQKKLLGPTLAALIAVILFSTGGLCIKRLDLSALAIAGFRAMVSAFFIGLYLVHKSKTYKLPKISRTGWLAAASYAVMTTTYVLSMKMTTAANAIFLQSTMPAWVLIGGAIWLRESITRSRLITIAFCTLGMMLFFIDELSPRQWQGNMFALVSGASYALLVLALRKDRHSNPNGAVFWGNAVTAILVIPVALFLFPDTLSLLTGWRTWIGLLWLGIFQIGLAYLLFVYALKYLPAIEVAIITLVEPLLNPFWVYLDIGEEPGQWAIIGGILILFSVIIKSLMRETSKEDLKVIE
jgi:drug/metabolite transporter (DMT)-like permease